MVLPAATANTTFFTGIVLWCNRHQPLIFSSKSPISSRLSRGLLPLHQFRFAGALIDGQVGVAIGIGAGVFLIFQILHEIGNARQAHDTATAQGPETRVKMKGGGKRSARGLEIQTHRVEEIGLLGCAASLAFDLRHYVLLAIGAMDICWILLQ